MKERKRNLLKYVVLAVLVGLLALWIVSGLLRLEHPNAELARTTRRALEMAREAQEEANLARRASSHYRLLAMAAGVVAPLVVAYLIHRLHARSESTQENFLEVLQEEKLIDLHADTAKELPAAHSQLLEPSSQPQETEKAE